MSDTFKQVMQALGDGAEERAFSDSVRRLSASAESFTARYQSDYVQGEITFSMALRISDKMPAATCDGPSLRLDKRMIPAVVYVEALRATSFQIWAADANDRLHLVTTEELELGQSYRFDVTAR